jgi:hypothetical protein
MRVLYYIVRAAAIYRTHHAACTQLFRHSQVEELRSALCAAHYAVGCNSCMKSKCRGVWGAGIVINTLALLSFLDQKLHAT